MIRRATIQSLAKVNLDLRVLNRRPDGFHELRTVFHTISLADTIEIEQGTKMGRRSIMRVSLVPEPEISGAGIIAMRGTLTL